MHFYTHSGFFYHCAILCTLCTVSCSIWKVTWVDRLLLYMSVNTNERKDKNSEKKGGSETKYLPGYFTSKPFIHFCSSLC